jgi:para-nitrobenzyl esterase
MTPTCTVDTSVGPVRGRFRDGVATFLGVPYAAAPLGARRFRPPEPRPRSREVLEADRHGPAAPQPPSRLEAAVGPMGLSRQDEDCLGLAIWSPAAERHDGPRPVLVWLHGGAFLAGAGSQAWYDGDRIARELGVVVVTVNYRLGVLGFLHLPDDDGVPSNLGLLDQLAALQWVQDNIAGFGGDPAAVTVAGQSAGAQSILAMLDHDGAGRVFHRAVLQSAPLGLRPLSPEQAVRRAALVLDELGISGAAGLREVPVAGLLAAQVAVSRREARPLHLGPPFQLVADDVVVPTDLLAPRGHAVPVVLTATEHEADAFTVPDPRVRAMTAADVRAALHPLFGESTDDRLAKQDPDAGPARVASDLVTAHYFHDDLEPLARRLRDRGAPVSTVRFTWHPPGSPLRAAHCIDLPFAFDTLDAWRDSPLLHGASPEELRQRACSLTALRRVLFVG